MIAGTQKEKAAFAGRPFTTLLTWQLTAPQPSLNGEMLHNE